MRKVGESPEKSPKKVLKKVVRKALKKVPKKVLPGVHNIVDWHLQRVRF